MAQQFINRIAPLAVIVASLLSYSCNISAAPKQSAKASTSQNRLAKIESDLGGRIGLFVMDTANGSTLGHRANERFPLCSTFKMMLAAAILKKSEMSPGSLQRRIHYRKSQLITHSPITEKNLSKGMTVAELCAATIQYSDNAAANLLLQILGGPQALTTFARSIGDTQFRLDRWETALNTAIPGDPRDTSTPAAMGQSVQRLILGNSLSSQSRQHLKTWLLGNTTGDERIRAGIPKNWKIGDKTGTGAYGTANDVAVIWPPKRAPIIVVIYTTRPEQKAKARNDVIVAATKVAVDWLNGK